MQKYGNFLTNRLQIIIVVIGFWNHLVTVIVLSESQSAVKKLPNQLSLILNKK